MRSFSRLSILVLAASALTVPAPGAGAATSSHAGSAARAKSVKTTAQPHPIGTSGDWTAVTLKQASQTICYTFARPQSSAPALPARGDVVITITERAKLRDTVALASRLAYAPGAEVVVTVGTEKFPFYTSGSSAFARNGTGLIAAFAKGDTAAVVSPFPQGKKIVSVTDQFSLDGFAAAMKTVLAACPDKP